MNKTMNRIAVLDKVMHNPARLMIVHYLGEHQKVDFSELMQVTALTSGNINTHLCKLAAQGYIRIKKSFKGKKPNTAIMLTQEGKRAFENWARCLLEIIPQKIVMESINHHKLWKIPSSLYFTEYSPEEQLLLHALPEHLQHTLFQPFSRKPISI